MSTTTFEGSAITEVVGTATITARPGLNISGEGQRISVAVGGRFGGYSVDLSREQATELVRQLGGRLGLTSTPYLKREEGARHKLVSTGQIVTIVDGEPDEDGDLYVKYDDDGHRDYVRATNVAFLSEPEPVEPEGESVSDPQMIRPGDVVTFTMWGQTIAPATVYRDGDGYLRTPREVGFDPCVVDALGSEPRWSGGIDNVQLITRGHPATAEVGDILRAEAQMFTRPGFTGTAVGKLARVKGVGLQGVGDAVVDIEWLDATSCDLSYSTARFTKVEPDDMKSADLIALGRKVLASATA